MNKPWELKTDEARKVDNIHTFLIFCEDETSEIEYFKWFETDLIKINLFPGKKNMMSNLIAATSYCEKHAFIGKRNDCDKYEVADGVEIWCVYDRDYYGEGDKELENNTNFNMAHEVAPNYCINVAWSNDSFELWILLNLYDIDAEDISYKNRETYYQLLEAYFRNCESPNERLVKILKHGTFSYKKDLKHRKNFNEVVKVEILKNTMTAIERAKKLLAFHSSRTNKYHEWSPCTLVFKLVEQLLLKGKKEIPSE
jgi:hypothetical protein